MADLSLKKIIDIVNANIENALLSEKQIDMDLLSMGMTSMSFIKIIVALEETFDCEIPDSKLLISEMNSIKKMLTVLEEIR